MMNKQQLEQNIKNMEAEIAKMKEELNKPEKFEFKYPLNNTYKLMNNVVNSGYTGNDSSSLECNVYRISEDNANAELLRNKQGNFIGALFEQIDVDYAEGINWSKFSQHKYYIQYNSQYRKWSIDYVIALKLPGVVYTPTRQIAQRALELLNSGRVEYPTS